MDEPIDPNNTKWKDQILDIGYKYLCDDEEDEDFETLEYYGRQLLAAMSEDQPVTPQTIENYVLYLVTQSILTREDFFNYIGVEPGEGIDEDDSEELHEYESELTNWTFSRLQILNGQLREFSPDAFSERTVWGLVLLLELEKIPNYQTHGGKKIAKDYLKVIDSYLTYYKDEGHPFILYSWSYWSAVQLNFPDLWHRAITKPIRLDNLDRIVPRYLKVLRRLDKIKEDSLPEHMEEAVAELYPATNNALLIYLGYAIDMGAKIPDDYLDLIESLATQEREDPRGLLLYSLACTYLYLAENGVIDRANYAKLAREACNLLLKQTTDSLKGIKRDLFYEAIIRSPEEDDDEEDLELALIALQDRTYRLSKKITDHLHV